MPSLVVSLDGKPQSTHAITRSCTRIGRAPGNDIVLAGSTVSSTHAVIMLSGSKLAIEDLESSNGTFLGAARITRADLEDGSVVAIGNYTLKLVADRRAMAYEPTMLVRSTAGGGKAFLQRLDGPLRGERIALGKVISTIGKPGGMPVDASSALMIMTLGAKKGDEVEVSGDDEQAVQTIAGLVEQDLDA